MAYIFAIHVPIARMSLLPVVSGRPLVLLPVRIAFLELLIDPACSLLIIANVGLILTNRSWTRTFLSTLRTPNKALWCVSGGAWVFLALVLYLPLLRDLFHFTSMRPIDLAICLSAGMVSILWFEVLKVLRRKTSLKTR